MSESSAAPAPSPPYAFKADVIAGFLVFLIALPLCLAIARASNFPPIAGIWTAVIGGVVCSLISNSQMTIKGPAAGLIVIVAGAVTELAREFGGSLDTAEGAMLGYRLTLGVGVIAGLIQVVLGLTRAGRLVEFFPLTPVHGMLAAIGLIVIAKQGFPMMGVEAPKPEPGHEELSPLSLLFRLPFAVTRANPEILTIGLVSLVILFGLPMLATFDKRIKSIPAQLVVLLVAVGLGFWFDLEHPHKYPFHLGFFNIPDAEFEVGPTFLVTIPDVLSAPLSAFAFPDFRGLATFTGMKYLLLFTLIGSLESLLSAKAVDLLDPLKRKTNFDRDLLAIGVANALAASIGGLPMISEIVRSSANINNGARSRFANLWHGVFLFGFVLLFPWLIHSIPLAALAAMLVYTGSRLASPSEFAKTYAIGSEQFVVFIATILMTLATDLLIGIFAGIALKVFIHLWNGAPLRSLFRPDVTGHRDEDGRAILTVQHSAVFTNWMTVRAAILQQATQSNEVVVNLAETRVVDHSVMEKLHELSEEFERQGKTLMVVGLDDHQPASTHPRAARKKVAVV